MKIEPLTPNAATKTLALNDSTMQVKGCLLAAGNSGSFSILYEAA